MGGMNSLIAWNITENLDYGFYVALGGFQEYEKYIFFTLLEVFLFCGHSVQ